jgi:hypothetical protein
MTLAWDVRPHADTEPITFIDETPHMSENIGPNAAEFRKTRYLGGGSFRFGQSRREGASLSVREVSESDQVDGGVQTILNCFPNPHQRPSRKSGACIIWGDWIGPRCGVAASGWRWLSACRWYRLPAKVF